MSTTVHTDAAPAAIGPYAQAVVAAGLVFTSGQIAIDPATGLLEGDTVAQQTERVCRNLREVLTAAGASLETAVKTTCFLTDMGSFAAFNEVYAQYCGQTFDKTATVTVKGNKTCSAKITRINGKDLDLTGRFRVMVVAKQGDKTLAKSLKCHVVGRKNRKYTNAKGIELVKTAVTLRAGKSASVKAKIVSADAAKKQLGSSHGAELRFETTDARVASVDKNGKITAKSKGKCTVYVFTRSGQAGKITVTVK